MSKPFDIWDHCTAPRALANERVRGRPKGWIFLSELTIPYRMEGRTYEKGHQQEGFILMQYEGQVYRMNVYGTSYDRQEPLARTFAVMAGDEFPISGDLL